MLSAKNICKSFSSNLVLRNASASVEPGRITVVLGPSGAGKTMLLRTLSLLDLPEQGTVEVDGLTYNFPLADGKQITPPWPKVTTVFQQLFLWPHLTLLQNIILPLTCSKQDYDKNKLRGLIDLFEMQSFIDRYPNEVSGGQRQRAALLRALVLNPTYILLDEITSALDIEQTAVILSYLKTLRSQGIGILAITHLLHFAESAADHIIFMDGGEILEEGGKEVLTSPKNERLKKFVSLIEAAS